MNRGFRSGLRGLWPTSRTCELVTSSVSTCVPVSNDAVSNKTNAHRYNYGASSMLLAPDFPFVGTRFMVFIRTKCYWIAQSV